MPNNIPPVLSDPAYRIEGELGSGGGGVVYRAWHTRLQKYVVIKELKCGTDQDTETQRNEVEALKNVKSAYLPQVYDFLTETAAGGAGKRIFTVMEFIEGDSFDKLLEDGRKFTQRQVVKWYGQLASALEAIHGRNVCHRDIKPANIMLMPNDDVCLIDFNAALVRGNDVRLISRSLGYASPEQYEIYERCKNTRSAPIRLESTTAGVSSLPGTETELLEETELLKETEMTAAVTEDGGLTEILPENTDTQKTELVTQAADGIDWKRSDIYSLGAAMYHLLTGKRPSERAKEVVPVSGLGQYGEGLVFVIEKSMKPDPLERFADASVLADAVRNIHKFDTRWKISQSRRIAAAIILPLAFVLFAGVTLFGRRVMGQEKEERYYAAVYEIENGDTPQESYLAALDMFRDRIDPYRAMAERLWYEGDPDACRRFIEENLGNLAKFQTDPEAERAFGDIYYILGNCYYYKSGGPDYPMACGNFEIALNFVRDNAIYYRDYAISLARTGNIPEAERALEKAQVLNIGEDSLNLLNGELKFAGKEYDSALLYLTEVIAHTDDDELRYRACHTADEIYRLQGRPELSVELLSDGLNRIPANRAPEMKERLADAYAKSGDADKAVVLFEELVDSMPPQFHIYQNLAILLENQDEFDRAAAVLNDMADLFPNDYRVPMRQAYLEADRQSEIRNENRDYALTKQYYDAAAGLYEANRKPGENDPEMEQLALLIGQLRNHKWID